MHKMKRKPLNEYKSSEEFFRDLDKCTNPHGFFSNQEAKEYLKNQGVNLDRGNDQVFIPGFGSFHHHERILEKDRRNHLQQTQQNPNDNNKPINGVSLNTLFNPPKELKSDEMSVSGVVCSLSTQF